jgi:hypothetical protein
MPSRYRSRGRARALLVLCLLPAVALAQAPPPVEDLRERATAYVDQFIARFSSVVAEERLLQETTSLPAKRGEGMNQQMTQAMPGRREIRSDFLFIRREASENWHVYRDAFEVDGRAVRDRGDRLMKLLTAPSLSNEQLAFKIAQESSRYSLSPGLRTVDDPILVLVFLQPKYHPRFRFTRGGRDRELGADVWVVNFQEQARPTMVRGQNNADAASTGKVWIDAATGRVMKTELRVNSSQVQTTFSWDESLGVAVPAEMRDSYMVGPTAFRARATYSRFRRFDVSTSEKIEP